MAEKLILRKRDGSMLRCTSRIPFSAAFHKITVLDQDGKVLKFPLSELKAIFFVKDFDGNPHYKAGREFGEGSPRAGRIFSVAFHDGEVIKGRVLNLAEENSGFFLYPADPLDNNEKVFIVRSDDLRVTPEPE
ncbi:MAG TPA: hypothetical protein PK747_00385 [Acidobacteriota bacterium]|mgnify:CR=1 FL=1|jgi:hypothetical protein|nr:hypothetical protein [Acidobacteriota bacterium]HNT16749.1 hypothetical protein [Acidobacteriota bacterium]HPA26883.1 hypothetical protein [Acidobacteriota bacterium]HQO20001.1 hypothetical protein [Acidobacteriota bacterium]HQQ45848.1 hypothetical protein [Acidobacteriota bacterium]